LSSITDTGGSKGGTRGYFDTPMINKLNDNEFNYIIMITKKEAKHLLNKMRNDNRMFSLEFIKKDGTKRIMLARFNVSKGLTGKGQRYNPADHDLINVYDMNKSAYRSVPLNRLLWLRTKGKRYYVSA
jgi:hypothetical protein